MTSQGESDRTEPRSHGEGDAPIKPEYIRKLERKVVIEAIDASGRQVEKKSKAQLRKSKHEQLVKARICHLFAQGNCIYGDSCSQSHDLDAFFKSKPPDLPGLCPYTYFKMPCPFGIACRWSGSHPVGNHIAKEEEFETERVEYGRHSSCTASVLSSSSSIKEDEKAPSQREEIHGVYAQVGTIPSDQPLPLYHRSPSLHTTNPVEGRLQREGSSTRACTTPTIEQKMRWSEPYAIDPLNTLSKELQASLRKRTYDFERTDAVLQQLGYKNTRKRKKPDLEKDSCIECRDTAREQRAEKARIDFTDKLFLAPLTTVGNLPFRRLAKFLGADVTCGEMALATNVLQGQSSEWALLKRHPEEDFFGVQIAGGFPDAMAACAQLIRERCNVDFVDLNFGCPIDIVCSKGAGAACLKQPARLESIMTSVSAVLGHIPMTVKVRKGYADDTAHTLMPHLASWGATAVTIHGRTREQRYSKAADWEYIAQCARAAAPTGLQVIGNGDVYSWTDHYAHLHGTFPLHLYEDTMSSDTSIRSSGNLATTYIARGALIKPWIFTEIKERRDWDISASERLELYKRFCALGLEHWGCDVRGVETTRRFFLEWLSFAHRYIPVGLLERARPASLLWRAPPYVGRSDLETLLGSPLPQDWIKMSEMFLGPAPAGFIFQPKHKANAHARSTDSVSGRGVDDQENG